MRARCALLDLTVLATSDSKRGVGRYAIDLARGIAALGHVDPAVLGVTALPWTGDPALTTDLEGAVEGLITGAGPVRSYFDWQCRLRLRLAHACRVAGAALVHTVHAGATPLGDLGCPRVTTCLDLIPLLYPEHYVGWQSGFTPGRRWLDRRRYHTADHVIAISAATAEDLVRMLEVPRAKVSVVHLGVDLDRFSPEPAPSDQAVVQRLGLDGRPYVLGVGALEWRKNVPGTIAAFARARRRPALGDLMLVWAGKWPARERAQIEATCEVLGVGQAVVLPGFVDDDDLAALYRGAHALLFMSRSEGFGYPPVEAMASGCPVVNSNCSSMVEVAGGAAIAVDPEDHEAIADAVVALADSAERSRWRAAGIERARRFTLERMALETLEVYRKVL